MESFKKIYNSLKTETLSDKIQVKREGFFGHRKVVLAGQEMLFKDLIAKIDSKIKELDENPHLDNIHEEIHDLHQIINKTKQLDRLDRSCFGLFLRVFRRGRSHQLKKSQEKLSSLSEKLHLKYDNIQKAKLLVLDKNPAFDVLNFKRAGILDIAHDYASAEIELKKEIHKLPPAARGLAIKKMEIMKEMVEYASALKKDHFKPNIIEKLIIYRIELKNAGISSSFPKTMEIDKSNPDAVEKGLIVDSNGTPFDHLRQDNASKGESATEKFAAFCQKRGGNYQVIKHWYREQAKNSWSPESNQVKNTLSNFRNVPKEKIWNGPELYKKQEKVEGGSTEIETLLMFMAFTTELLSQTDFPGKNADGTIMIYRTESKTALELNGIKDVSDTKEHTMTRGFVESGSIIAPVKASGTHVTEQRVPIHRVVGTYLTERLFQKFDGSEPEKEFICMFDDIPFKYTASI